MYVIEVPVVSDGIDFILLKPPEKYRNCLLELCLGSVLFIGSHPKLVKSYS